MYKVLKLAEARSHKEDNEKASPRKSTFDKAVDNEISYGVYDDKDERNFKDRYKEPIHAKRNKVKNFKDEELKDLKADFNNRVTHIDYEKMPNEKSSAYKNKLKEADEDLPDDENLPDDELSDEEVEDQAQEDLSDTIEDDVENEDYAVDKDLDDLRDVLVDLDWKLYMLTQGDKDDVCYIIGRINGEDTEMLVSNPNPTTDEQSFDWIELPLAYNTVLSYDTIYGKKDENGEDIRPNHEAIMDYLMSSLEETDPEKYEELQNNSSEEQSDNVVSLDDLGSDENEDNEEEDVDEK